jgi:hypothetical protein
MTTKRGPRKKTYIHFSSSAARVSSRFLIYHNRRPDRCFERLANVLSRDRQFEPVSPLNSPENLAAA